MNLATTFRHMDASQAVKEYAEEMYGPALEARVTHS